MTKPIVNRLTAAIEAKLSGISRAAGYRFDADVECEGRTAHRTRDGLLILSRAGLPRLRDDSPCGKDDYDQDFAVQFHLPIGEGEADLSADDLLAVAQAEIFRAVMDDHQHNGLAVRTYGWSGEPVPADGGGINAGTVRFTCHYRTALDDPYNP